MSALQRYLHRRLDRFYRLPPGALARDVARAVRLHAPVLPAPALAAERRSAVPPRPERVVVTLTTVPGRLPRLRPVLRSLLDQSWPPDRVLLALPSHSLRTGRPYPPPPPLPAGVDVLRCEDHGPATKVLPALAHERDAVLVVVDDDVIYPVHFLRDLLTAHRAHPRCAIGLRGWRLEPAVHPRDLRHVFGQALREPAPVDVLLGTWGYLIPPGALDDAVHDYSGWPSELRWCDDIWISGHLCLRGIPRMVIPSRGLPLETRSAWITALTDTINRSGHNDVVGLAAFPFS